MRASYLSPSAAGFTLIEVIVSIAILAAVVVGLADARTRAARNAAMSRQVTDGTRFCASLVAAVRSGTEGEGKGACEGGYAWQVSRLDPPEIYRDYLEGFAITVLGPGGLEESATNCVVWRAKAADKVAGATP